MRNKDIRILDIRSLWFGMKNREGNPPKSVRARFPVNRTAIMFAENSVDQARRPRLCHRPRPVE